MHRPCCRALLGLAILVLPPIAGCGSKAADKRPRRVPFTAKVTLAGAPIEGATVVLSPEAADGRAASGMTDAQGAVTFTTFEARDGAVPGRYGVAVSKTEFPDGVPLTADDPNYDPRTAVAAVAKGAKELVPVRYKSPATSGITVEVKDGKNDPAVFELSN